MESSLRLTMKVTLGVKPILTPSYADSLTYDPSSLGGKICKSFSFFFLNDPAPTEISPLPQPAALPICPAYPRDPFGEITVPPRHEPLAVGHEARADQRPHCHAPRGAEHVVVELPLEGVEGREEHEQQANAVEPAPGDDGFEIGSGGDGGRGAGGGWGVVL